jgi:hypothetical protein
MKTKIVLAGILATLTVLEVSAQRAEYDDMYFRGKDREKNKAMDAEESFASAKTKKQKSDDVVDVVREDEDNTNPTDSYSARNINPEYVSRSNSEQASEDEDNYYLEGYAPASSSSNSNFNNSYYNNANWARNSFYANNSWNSPYYGGCGYCDPWMSPYGGGFYDPWMTPAFGYGPSYGWRTGWSVSLTYGNYWSPWGYAYGNPYYYSGYGYPGYYGYYGGNSYYNESPRVVNYGKRPSRHSAVVQPTERAVTRSRNTVADNAATINSSNRTRQRQTQDEYYVRPSRRTSSSIFTDPAQRNSGGSGNNIWTPSGTQPARTRETYTPSSRPSPSYTPSPSSSPSRSSGSSGGGGSSPRPRGRN